MRNLRKVTAVVVAVALVLTSMAAVFAADSATIANADKAATLKDLGLYSGQDANDPKVGLEDALTTQDSLIFLAKLFGYFETASSLADDQVAEDLAKFDDAASISDYAKNVVAYSASNNILSGSTKDGKFFVGAKDTVTAARFATFMLKQMGYTVADYKLSVAKLAETKGSKVDATLTGDLTRDAAVGVMYGALTAEKASGKTVIADIVGDNADLKAKAEKLGIIVAPPLKPENIIDGGSSTDSSSSGGGSSGGGSNGGGSQESGSQAVKAINNKQIEIKFNVEMDEASVQNQANYIIKDKGDIEKTLTSTSCKLGDDKKTVTITLDSTVQDCLTNESTAKVILSKDIMSAQEDTLGVAKQFSVEVQDRILPTVTSVKHTGEKNIQITFSEPVYEGQKDNDNENEYELTTSNFAVKSGTYTYYVQKAKLDLNVINLEVGTKLIEGPITVTVNEKGLSEKNIIQDYAGYKVFKGEHTFNYVKDNSVSVVTVKSAVGNKVVLGFSKPVKGANIKLYHTNKTNGDYMAEASTTGYVDEIAFTFSKELPSGTLNLYLVNSDTDAEKITDGYGINVPDQTLTCEIVIDNTAPKVTACKVDKNESIMITFNEEIDIKAASDPNNYVVIKLSDNKKIDFEVVVDDSRKSVKLVFSTKLEDNTEFKLLIKEYMDICGNKNASDYEFKFTTGDNTAPTVLDNPGSEEHCFAIAEKGLIFIVFSEPMNEAQMLDKVNYMVSIDGGKKYYTLNEDDNKITKVNDRTVQIYVKELEGKNDSTIRPYVKIAPIMDLAGKRLNYSVDSVIVENIQPENVSIKEAQLIAKDKIKIVFNKKMGSVSASDIVLTTLGSISVSNCELTTPGSISVSIIDSTIINSDVNTEVIFTLNKELATDVTDEAGDRIGITTIAHPSSESVLGSKLKPLFGSSVYIEDKTAPEIVKVIAGGDIANPQVYSQDYTVPQNTTGTITITFSEDIKESTLTVHTFNVPGFTITNISAPAETKTVVLTVKADADNTSVITTLTQASEIYDTADNAFNPGSTWAVMVPGILIP